MLVRNFFWKFSEFMYGRYGNDKLNIGLAVLWLAVNILNTVLFRSIWLRLFDLLIVILIIFRCLSKNILQRTKENKIFLDFCERAAPFVREIPPFFRRVADWFKLQHRKFKDRKTHRYIKCPYCKAVIRVPFRKGEHSLRCPKCCEYVKTNIRL